MDAFYFRVLSLNSKYGLLPGYVDAGFKLKTNKSNCHDYSIQVHQIN